MNQRYCQPGEEEHEYITALLLLIHLTLHHICVLAELPAERMAQRLINHAIKIGFHCVAVHKILLAIVALLGTTTAAWWPLLLRLLLCLLLLRLLLLRTGLLVAL